MEQPETSMVEEIELVPSSQTISTTLKTWTLRWPHRGKKVAKLLLANEQNAFLVRELVAVWLYFREPPAAQGENMPSKDVSILITKFSEYWCLLEALRTAASIDSLWRIVSKFCRGEFKKRSESNPPKSKNEIKKKPKQQPKVPTLDQKTAPQWGGNSNLLLMKQEDNDDDAMSMDEPMMSVDEPQQQHQRDYLRKDQHDDACSSDESMSADEDEAAAQGLWLWWQHASAAANTAINCVQSTAAAAKRLRSG